MIKNQQLIELEEIILYKENKDIQETIKEMWKKRINGCENSIDVWQNIVSIRNVILKPNEQIDTYLKFAKICRKNNNIILSESTLNKLINKKDYDPNNIEHLLDIDPKISFEYLKLLYNSNDDNIFYINLLENFIKLGKIYFHNHKKENLMINFYPNYIYN
jgi:FKBP12-rapamycin complex-associated protein